MLRTQIIPDQIGNHPCPFHQDKTASLSVFQGSDGRLRWKCHAGCGRGLVDDQGTYTAKRDPIFHEPQATEDQVLRAMDRFGFPPDQELERRRISSETCVQHNVRFNMIMGRWVFPVADATGRLRAVKWHQEKWSSSDRAFPAPSQKCGWLRLAPGRCGMSTLFPRPEEFSKRELLMICPGELKALRVISTGRQAVSPTAGESFKWPMEELARFEGFRCVLIGDKDEAGERFVDLSRRRFSLAGVPLEVVYCETEVLA